MGVVIIEGMISPEQLVIVQEEYGEYVKTVVDIEMGLLAAGSLQENLWGGGVNLLKKKIEFNSLINMRPRLSVSQEVLDQRIRDKMEEIMRRIFKL